MIDDQALREVLKQKIKLIKLNHPRSFQKKIENEMANRFNVLHGNVTDIFNEISPYSIDELDYNMLYKLMVCVREVSVNSNQKLDSSDLFDKKYFMDSEITEFNQPYPDENKDIDLIITDWKQVSPYKYKIYTNIDEVILWRNYNKLRFNPATQRDLITIKLNGKTIKKLDINKDSKKEMKNLMIKGLYYNVCGTININPDVSPLPYKDGKNLVIPKEAHMDLIEGFHNYLAETELKDENPDWQFDIEFDLRILNEEEANQFIIQMNKKNHFKPAQVVRIDKLDEVNYVIDTLNKHRDFHLYGTIDDNIKVYLNKVISYLFDIKDDREKATELLDILEEKLNYIIKKYKHFGKPLTKLEWFVYINIIKFSIQENIELENIIDHTDMNLLFEECSSMNDPAVKYYKLINKQLKEVIKNVL